MAKYDMKDPKPWDDPELLERLYWGEDMSLYQIADRWDGASAGAIRWQMQKHDIPRRDDVEGKRLRYKYEVSISESRGRLIISFSDLGEQVKVPYARALALSEWPLDEIAGKDVHHKNGCSLDDRIENLEVLTDAEHQSQHAPDSVPKISSERRRELAKRRERDEHGRFV